MVERSKRKRLPREETAFSPARITVVFQVVASVRRRFPHVNAAQRSIPRHSWLGFTQPLEQLIDQIKDPV